MKPYFETELGQLFNCNCVDYMKTVPDNTFDLAITSPPYDNLRDYKGYEFDFESIAKELYRITKQGGVVVWVVGDATINGSETGSSFRQALYFMECGFNLHDTMIYERVSPFPMNNRYHPSFEYMFVFSKDKPKTFNRIMEKRLAKTGGSTFRNSKGELNAPDTNAKIRINNANKNNVTSKKNVWKYFAGGVHSSKDKIAFKHPAIFPEKLAYDHIISWSNEGDLVLDPFMGSGTTAKMCEKLNRKWIGCEIAEEYCEIAKRRIKAEADQLKLRM